MTLVRGGAAAVVAVAWVTAGATTWATAASAGEVPLYQPAPDWVTPAPPIDPAKLNDQSPVVLVLDRQSRLQDGEVWAYSDTATRVATSEMLGQVGTLGAEWQPAKGDLIIHKVEVIRGAEHIDLLAQGKKFTVLRREEQLEKANLTGLLTATMVAEGLRVGDVLHVVYSSRQKDAALGGGVQAAVPLPAAPFRAEFGRLRLLWPAATPVRWKSYADEVKPRLTTAGAMQELSLPLPVAKLPDMPDDAPLRFRPVGLVEASSFADWAAVSKVMAPLYGTDGLVAAGTPLAAEVARIKAAETDPLKRAALALQLVQGQVRYFFVGLDQGNYMPQAPAQTWSLRYGDCKAKTLLLLAILHALDIEAEPVLASINLGDMVPKRLPAPGAFDHILVRATIGGESLWLDGTDNGARLADLKDTPPFRWVLPVRAGGATLMEVAMRPPARPNVEVTVERDQTAGLPLPSPFTARVVMRGRDAEMARVAASQATAEQRMEMATALLGKLVDDAGDVTASTISFDEASGTATIAATGIASSRWTRRDGRYRADLDTAVSKLSFQPDRARPAWQALPVATGAPFSIRLTTRYHLPAGAKDFTIEGDRALPAALAGYALNRTTSLADGWLTVTDQVTSTGAEIAPADIAAQRAAIALAKGHLLKGIGPADTPMRWQLVAGQRPGTGFAAIRAAYQAGIDTDTKEARPYVNRAVFLASIYDRKAAIADYDRAIAIEPSVDNYQARANLFKELGDRDHALADLLAAQKLDPGSDDVAYALADLRYDRGEKDQAFALVQERIDAGGERKSQLMALKADLLGRSGDKDAALATMDQAIAAAPGKASLLNQRCWLKATLNVALDTALKDCTKSIELSDSNSAALDSRALVYYRMGRSEDALADLGAALELSPGQAGSLFLRGIIRDHAGQAKLGEPDLAAARLIDPTVESDYKRFGLVP